MRLRFLLVLTLCGLLAACGASGTTGGTTTHVTATKPAVSVRPTVAQSQIPASCNIATPSPTPLVRVGDVVATQVQANLQFPSYVLPPGTSLKPLQIQDPSQNPNPGTPPAALDTGNGGYLIQACNTSTSQQHTLRDLSVRIDHFTPYSGALNAWNPCDGVYEAQSKQVQGRGCGGGLAPVDETLRATFAPNAGLGASVTAAQVGTGNAIDPTGPSRAPLPLILKPGEGVVIHLTLVAPTVPGTYAFTVGMGVDSEVDDFYSTTEPALFASVAHKWSGQACVTSDALRQIPPPTDPVYYICPGS